MDSLLPRTRAILSRRDVLAGLALAALTPSGCLTKYLTKKDSGQATAPPPQMEEPQQRLVSVWDNKINFSPDASRGGAPMPVLVGRVFLFGNDIDVVARDPSCKTVVKPYVGDGSLIVDLYDNSPRHGADADPKLIDELRIDAATLKRFVKTDVFGDGYTIMFPWYTYRPDISHVYIIMRYTFPDGKFLVHQSGTVTINHTEAQERIRKGMTISNPAMRAVNLPRAEDVLAPTGATAPATR